MLLSYLQKQKDWSSPYFPQGTITLVSEMCKEQESGDSGRLKICNASFSRIISSSVNFPPQEMNSYM